MNPNEADSGWNDIKETILSAVLLVILIVSLSAFVFFTVLYPLYLYFE